MLLTIFIILLVVNIIGFFNRKKPWAKIYMVVQVFMVAGLAIMFNMSNNQSGIEGMQADDKKGVKELKEYVKEQKEIADTADFERTRQDGNKVKN